MVNVGSFKKIINYTFVRHWLPQRGVCDTAYLVRCPPQHRTVNSGACDEQLESTFPQAVSTRVVHHGITHKITTAMICMKGSKTAPGWFSPLRPSMRTLAPVREPLTDSGVSERVFRHSTWRQLARARCGRWVNWSGSWMACTHSSNRPSQVGTNLFRQPSNT